MHSHRVIKTCCNTKILCRTAYHCKRQRKLAKPRQSKHLQLTLTSFFNGSPSEVVNCTTRPPQQGNIRNKHLNRMFTAINKVACMHIACLIQCHITCLQMPLLGKRVAWKKSCNDCIKMVFLINNISFIRQNISGLLITGIILLPIVWRHEKKTTVRRLNASYVTVEICYWLVKKCSATSHSFNKGN